MGKTEELVTEGLVLSPSVFSELGSSYNVQQVEGTSDPNIRYSGAGLTLSNDMTLRLKITSTNPSAYTYEVSINGRTSIYTYEDLEDNRDGTYYLYYSGWDIKRGGHQIGVATSSSPKGPFVDYKGESANGYIDLNRSPFQMEFKTIDASPFIDDNGDKYLLLTKNL